MSPAYLCFPQSVIKNFIVRLLFFEILFQGGDARFKTFLLIDEEGALKFNGNNVIFDQIY